MTSLSDAASLDETIRSGSTLFVQYETDVEQNKNKMHLCLCMADKTEPSKGLYQNRIPRKTIEEINSALIMIIFFCLRPVISGQ